MAKLLIIADDFTGALDTGVQFASRGADTCVVIDSSYDFAHAKADVLVLDTETRHLPAEKAYDVVFQVTQSALRAGVEYVYKKTDSALRGNVGAELTAVLEAAKADTMSFIPAFPKMGRVTKDGIQYINGVPVSESVFGKDPFEPVRQSNVAELIALQSSMPVILHRMNEPPQYGHGIHLYDAQSDEELIKLGGQLGPKGLRLSAGCAGFAAVLAECLGMKACPSSLPKLNPILFVVCGSMNPVTICQMKEAEKAGFPHIHLKIREKLEPEWLESKEGKLTIKSWLTAVDENGCCILDVNDPLECQDTAIYAKEHGLSMEKLRTRISAQLGKLMKLLLENGLEATILCTGGDTLLAIMRAVNVNELIPVCEMAPGTVLTTFAYRDHVYHIISKSGGFGEPDLFCRLLVRIGNGKERKGIRYA